MIDFEKARRMMVDGQIKTVDVTDRAVLAALGSVPRELFVPEKLRPLAYIDADLAVNEPSGGRPPRYLMEPGPFARLVQAAEISPGDVVLDIGSATGYSAAVLAQLAKTVVALERDLELARLAEVQLGALKIANASVVHGALEAGYSRGGPYDVILLEGAVEQIPSALFDQLKDGGRLLAVVGYGRSAPAMLYVRSEGDISARAAFDAHVRPLPGFEKPKAFVF